MNVIIGLLAIFERTQHYFRKVPPILVVLLKSLVVSVSIQIWKISFFVVSDLSLTLYIKNFLNNFRKSMQVYNQRWDHCTAVTHLRGGVRYTYLCIYSMPYWAWYLCNCCWHKTNQLLLNRLVYLLFTFHCVVELL